MSRTDRLKNEPEGSKTSEEFPPITSRPDEIEAVVGVFASLLEGRTAFYVSSPLTTGQRAFEWHRRLPSISGKPPTGSGVDSFRRDVIEPNRAQAARFVRDLRLRTERAVIDPTAMADLPGWTQADYRILWARVIEEYAETVVLRNGWQYSSGCAYEFLAARSSGARLLREDLSPLDMEDAHSLLAGAIEESQTRGLTTDFLRRVLETAVTAPARGQKQ